MDKNIGIIYIAFNKVSNRAYIGQTIENLNRRISKHYSQSKIRNYPFSLALRKYKKDDWIWVIIYNNVPRKQLNSVEKWAIANYNTYLRGYNATKGGDDNPTNNPLVREKLSKINKGKKLSKETKDKISESLKGRKFSDITRERLSKAAKGKIVSKETREKLSIINKGKKLSPEHINILKIVNTGNKYNLGRKASKKTREKMSESRKNMKHSEETKLKISIGNKGKVCSKETKDKMAKAKALTYRITFPNGDAQIISNMKKYCRENKLSSPYMFRLANGKCLYYKGYRVEKI